VTVGCLVIESLGCTDLPGDGIEREQPVSIVAERKREAFVGRCDQCYRACNIANCSILGDTAVRRQDRGTVAKRHCRVAERENLHVCEPVRAVAI